MQMNYETSRLVLRILPQTAAGQVLRFYLDNQEIFEQCEPERPKNFYTEEFQRTLLHCEYHLAVKQSAVRFWVFEKNSEQQVIGTVSMQNIRRGPYQSCELGYKFDHRFWGRGYARESIYQAVSVAFDDMKLHRIEALVLPDNLPSQRLLETLGFHKEGIKKQSVLLQGAFRDHEVYALLAG